MKIIKAPFETIITCEECGCEFEFDKNDIYIESIELQSFTGHRTLNIINVDCPLCGKKYILNKKEKQND
jgi:redox-regulated HSP33 family molecular chaperone